MNNNNDSGILMESLCRKVNGKTPQKRVLDIYEEGNKVNCPVAFPLLKAIKLKGKHLFDHSVMVGALAEMVGISMGFEPKHVHMLKIAGLLHDVGKIPIRSEILLKPGPLSEREREIIRTHPGRGAETIMEFAGFERIADIVLRHHEEDDGSGYPDGLKGASIPFDSKIIKLCDVFSAVTLERSYKPSYPKQQAIEISMKTVDFNREHQLTIYELLESIHVK